MQTTFRVMTDKHEGLYDITEKVKEIVSSSGVKSGLCHVYVKHATAAVMIQENWDDSVQTDVVNFLSKIIPQGVWDHDKHDGNADSHIKSGLVGPSETIPIGSSSLLLGTWQNIFLCEFDGPKEREIIVTVLGDEK